MRGDVRPVSKEIEQVIQAGKELFDAINNNRIWTKMMFGECPEDEIDEKLKIFSDKYEIFTKTNKTK
jgi:hypothetical protein